MKAKTPNLSCKMGHSNKEWNTWL